MSAVAAEPRWSITDAWPGLARLWQLGSFTGLVMSVLAGGLLNYLLLSCWVWTDGCDQAYRPWLLGVTCGTWCVGIWDARRVRRQAAVRRRSDPHLDLLITARNEYLAGRWAEAESTLQRLLQTSPNDAEGRLLLATLLRHQQRTKEAREQLRRLQRWDRAALWNQEIRQEWQHLAVDRLASAPGPHSLPHHESGDSVEGKAAPPPSHRFLQPSSRRTSTYVPIDAPTSGENRDVPRRGAA